MYLKKNMKKRKRSNEKSQIYLTMTEGIMLGEI